MSGRSFFLRGKKNSQKPASKEKASRFNERKFENKKRSFHQEEIDSDEEVGDHMEIDESDVSSKKNRGLLDDADDGSGSDVDETAQQKRLRLAESYLRERAEAIEQQYDEDDDQDDEERDAEVTGALSRRLEEEILDQQGKLIQRIADSIKLLQTTKQKRKDVQGSFVCDSKEAYPGLHCVTLRGHRRAVTSVALSSTGEFVLSGAKDGSLCKWNALTGQRERLVCRLVARSQRGGSSAGATGGARLVVSQNVRSQNTDGKKAQESGHKHAVLAVAVSCDDRFVASGDVRGTILVWTFAELRCLRALTGHRGAITALSFRKVPFSAAASGAKPASGARKQDEAAHTLFSASADRTVKQWDVDQLAYVDTMLGHEDAITGLDALFAERCVTSGGRDASVRVFKPALESQLVFHGDGAAVECVAALSDRFFVSGSDRNCVSLWNVMRKKPVQTISNAHGAVELSNGDHKSESHAFDAGDSSHDIWISAIAALPNSDVFATGARDGYVRVWQCKVDADGVAEAGDGETPSRRRITLSNNWRRQQSEHLRGVHPTPLILVPIRGVVNSLSIRLAPAAGHSTDTDELVVAVAAAREHKAGRWWKVRDAQNVVKVFRFSLDKRARLASANGAGQLV